MKKLILYMIFVVATASLHAQTWQAPPEADQLVNPLAGDETAIKKGEKIYQSLCAACHGKDGKANVPSMQNLNPKPTDLTSDYVQNQSDGALFWKISEGRGLMAGYKNMLSEEERWALVNYIRTFKKKDEPDEGDTGEIEIVPDNEPSQQDQPTQQATDQISANHSPAKASSSKSRPVDAFAFTMLINSRTTHIMNPKGFGLNIQHRFGATKFDKSMITNFFGLDLAANTRIAFEIPYNEKLMFEIGRTRYGKYYDAGFKYLIVQQTSDNKIPVSIAIYENIAITTDVAPTYGPDATFAHGTLFEYKFYHRLAYDNELIISRKFNNKLSGQITLQLVWKNLMPYTEPQLQNIVWAVPIAFRYRLNYSQALSMEIMPNSQPLNFPISFAYEVASSGNHVFQITVTNSDRFLAQNLYTVPTYSYAEDGFILGFNLIRYF